MIKLYLTDEGDGSVGIGNIKATFEVNIPTGKFSDAERERIRQKLTEFFKCEFETIGRINAYFSDECADCKTREGHKDWCIHIGICDKCGKKFDREKAKNADLCDKCGVKK